MREGEGRSEGEDDMNEGEDDMREHHVRHIYLNVMHDMHICLCFCARV